MQLGDRDELAVQIRDYDTCFAEFLKPSGNGQKILQAILLREAFSLFALQGVAIKRTAPTIILDVSCGPVITVWRGHRKSRGSYQRV
jgi:hypothetical protein